jgi:hypothetical protein
MIEVKIHKHCILLLTAEEYQRSLARGKALRRRQAFERRVAQQPSRGAANTPVRPTTPTKERDDDTTDRQRQ